MDARMVERRGGPLGVPQPLVAIRWMLEQFTLLPLRPAPRWIAGAVLKLFALATGAAFPGIPRTTFPSSDAHRALPPRGATIDVTRRSAGPHAQRARAALSAAPRPRRSRGGAGRDAGGGRGRGPARSPARGGGQGHGRASI